VWLSITFCTAGQTNLFPEFRVESSRQYLKAINLLVPAEMGTNAESLFLQARTESHLGAKDEAERLAHKALELEPTRADILVFLSELFVRKDRMEEAKDCLEKAARTEPRCKGGHRELGMVLDRLGDHRGAFEAYRTAVRDFPDDAMARLLLGRRLLDEGKVAEAIPHLEKACELEPETGNAFYALFQAQTKAGDRDKAAKALARFQQLKRSDRAMVMADDALYDNEKEMRRYCAGLHVELGTSLLKQRKEQQGEAHLRQAIQVAPEQPAAFEFLGAFYLARDRLPDARSMYERLVRLNPVVAKYRVNLGTTLLRLKQLAAAEAEWKQALLLNPDEPEALYNMARLYLGTRRDPAQALSLSQRLVGVDSSAASYDLLGWALYVNGKTNDAFSAASQAAERDPTNTFYRERQRRLKEVVGAAR
jgi:tetratricopeptide (TPR) repeat protein